MRVPVISSDGRPLMPTIPSRARRWIKARRATPFFRKGLFCVRLNDLVGTEVQSIAVGIDPGSKWEGFTVKSSAHTFLNVHADAVTWVRDAVTTRREMRKGRRFRNTPCRANRAASRDFGKYLMHARHTAMNTATDATRVHSQNLFVPSDHLGVLL
jgi:hypothetical protein